MKKFTGTGVAVITPFTKDIKVDYSSLSKIINHLIKNGIDYFVVMGSTAEAATINPEEKKEIASFFVKETKGRIPLVLGVGGNNTQKVIDEISHTDFTGYDAILSVVPAYNKPSQEGLYRHFKSVSKASPLPVILYNVPGRTGVNMTPQTVIRLATEFENIIGIKEAAGDMEQVLELINTKPENFSIISGDDMLALPIALSGGSGVISVIAQAFPRDFATMMQLGLKGDARQAYQLHYKVMDAINLIFEEGNPTGIKALLNQQAFCANELRLPLVKASQELQSKIAHFLQNYK